MSRPFFVVDRGVSAHIIFMSNAIKDYFANVLRWRPGRQGTGYEKMVLLVNPWLVPFDSYLIRYQEGRSIPPHTDPVTDRRHFRLNIILSPARKGGEFYCDDPIIETRRIKLFRPDKTQHSVTKNEEGTRLVFSFGWVLPSAKKSA